MHEIYIQITPDTLPHRVNKSASPISRRRRFGDAVATGSRSTRAQPAMEGDKAILLPVEKPRFGLAVVSRIKLLDARNQSVQVRVPQLHAAAATTMVGAERLAGGHRGRG